MDFASYGLPPSRSVEVLEADNTSGPPTLYYPRAQVQPPIPGSASATVSWPFAAFLHEQSSVAESTSQALGSSWSSEVRGLVPAQPSIFSLSTSQQQQSTIISAATSSSPQPRLVSIAPSQSYVAPSANLGALSLPAVPAGRHGYLIPARPPPSASDGCDVNMLQSSSHPPVVFERNGVERPPPAASSRSSRTVSFVNHPNQVASHSSIAPGQTTRTSSSRHARFSARAASTTTTATSVSPALTYVNGHQLIEEVKSTRPRFLASQHDPAAPVAEANRHNSRSSLDRALCPKPLVCDVEPVRSAIGECVNQSYAGRNGFPSFNRQATFPPPSHPATRHTPKPSPSRRNTYYEEPSYPDDVLPTDVFAYSTHYASLQEWLSETDAGLCTSRSPTFEQTPPPEVTFPDLELLEAEINAEEAFLSDDAYFALEGVRAVVHLDGDAVMEGEDEDIDAEGSTEDESEMDDDNVYEVVGGGPTVEEVPEPSSVTQLQEQEQEHVQSSPENTTKVLPCPSKRSSTAETLATETAGSADDASSRRSTPLDAQTTAPSIASRDGSVLSSADGEGETDDEYADSPDEEAESPDETESLDDVESPDETESSATVSRASSPASSVSIPLSHHCRAASRASPSQQPESDSEDEVTRSSPPRSSSLTPPPKSSTNRRARAPYQRTRPPTQPLEGIPDGSAEYSEVTKLYKCTCHGRTYRRKGDLQRHLSEGSLPEVCDGCGRGFPRKDPRIRHWNQNPLCEAIHHVKNLNDSKEASRWTKRWTSATFAGKVAAMERLVEEQLSLLASGADPINHVEEIIPRTRTRTRVTPATRRPRHKKAAKRRIDSDEETEDDFDDGELEEDSFHPSKVVALAIVRDDLMSESRRATLRRKGQDL